MKANRVVGLVVLILVGVGLLLPVTRDELRWTLASSQDDAQSYAQYLTAWPEGRHAKDARNRYDERSWANAQGAGTLEGYRQYESTQPNGKYLSDVRTRIEDLTWQEVANAQTIRSLQAYSGAYPQGRFIVAARTREAALRVDERPFAAAVQKGTERDLREFLADFPGHVKEGHAQRALKEITEGRDVVDLLKEKKIEVAVQGSGIQTVNLRVRRLVSYPLTVRIPVGTYFVAARRSAQNMVATTESKVRLGADTWQTISVSVACANRPRDIPGNSDTFSVQRSPHQKELALLMPVLDRAGVSYATRQAAVWMVTDNASYSDLGVLVSSPGGMAFGGTRTIQETETARAMKICHEAGIDITRKRIWMDKQKIMRGLNDGELRKWLESKK